MTYSKELQVGAALVLAILIFLFGVRYFQGIPVFSGTYDLFTTFDNAGGLVSGNPVTVNGVNVGLVKEVGLADGSQSARVRFQVDKGTEIPEGSTASVAGIAALGSVQLAISPGPVTNPLLEDGDALPGQSGDLLGSLTDRAPALVDRADTLLATANLTFGQAQTLLASTQGDIQQTLAALSRSANTLDRLLRAEQQRLDNVLANFEQLSGNLNTFTAENQDSLAQTVQHINAALFRLDTNLASLETTTASLNAIMGKVERGEGTLGLLVNDESLYYQIDSTFNNLNSLIDDFKANPKRYLKDLKLVDVF